MNQKRRSTFAHRWQFSLKQLLIVSIAISLACGALVWLAKAMQPRLGCNLPTSAGVWRVPANATQINFYDRGLFGPISFREFTIDEPSFRIWAQQEGWPVAEITTPYSMFRISTCPPSSSRLPEKIITSGLLFDLSTGRDSGLHVAFDRQDQRAFLFDHTR